MLHVFGCSVTPCRCCIWGRGGGMRPSTSARPSLFQHSCESSTTKATCKRRRGWSAGPSPCWSRGTSICCVKSETTLSIQPLLRTRNAAQAHPATETAQMTPAGTAQWRRCASVRACSYTRVDYDALVVDWQRGHFILYAHGQRVLPSSAPTRRYLTTAHHVYSPQATTTYRKNAVPALRRPDVLLELVG